MPSGSSRQEDPAQAMMRHSTIGLTMGTYTDESLLNQRDALAALPPLPAMEARGVAVNVAVNGGPTGQSEATAGNPDAKPQPPKAAASDAASRVSTRGRPRGARAGTTGRKRAGDGIRTHDVQLGRLSLYH